MEKNKGGQGRWMVSGLGKVLAHLNGVVRVGLIENVTIEPELKCD